jgi:hypothetical protein
MAKGTVERSIENIFDGVFSRAFKSGVKPLQIGRRLLQVVDSERDLDAQGRRVVPNSYVVQMSAADREGFADLEGSLLQELTAALREYIATHMRTEAAYNESMTNRLLKPVMIAERAINDFVTWMGFEKLPIETRPKAGRDGRSIFIRPAAPMDDMPKLSETPMAYDAAFLCGLGRRLCAACGR